MRQEVTYRTLRSLSDSTTTAAAASPTAFPTPFVPNPIVPAAQHVQPARKRIPYIEDEDMPEEKMFYGDGRAGESPHDFKKKVMQRFTGKGMSDAEKIAVLGYGLASGSPADAWFDDPARDAVDKTTWDLMSKAFDVKWPKRPALLRTGQEAIEDLLAEKLNAEDIGKRVEYAGVEEFGHVVWVWKVVRIAGNIPDPGGLFIGVVVEKLPLLMQDLLVPGTVFADWAAFETAVSNIKQAAITNALAKEARLAGMVKATDNRFKAHIPMHLPAEMHPQRFAPRNYPIYPPYIPPQIPVLPQQPNPAAPRVFRPDAERLVDLLKNVPVHHPATDAGRVAYAQLVTEWHARNGNRGPNELRPYPLTPGTAPLDSRGECFNCAQFGHITNDCPNPAMPPLEKKWRQIAASIRNGAARSAPAPVPVQYVSTPFNFDPNTAYPYTYYHQYSPPYHTPEYDTQNQGNGQGPSN
ncbi:hypothetical protein C8R45DRAFT_1094289 [Mycena sanguinolenta]|nr:hypothetical protein C8R45DRAFT_1094289 [Mycena sanguinolenta]